MANEAPKETVKIQCNYKEVVDTGDGSGYGVIVVKKGWQRTIPP